MGSRYLMKIFYRLRPPLGMGWWVVLLPLSILPFFNNFAIAAWPSAPAVNVPVFITENPHGIRGPNLISDGTGGGIFVWSDTRTGWENIYAQRADGNGVPLWRRNGIPLAPGNWKQFWSDITSDGKDGAIIVWSEEGRPGAPFHVFYAQRVDVSGNLLWGETGKFVRDGGGFILPKIATDNEGGAFILMHTTAFELWLQRLDKDGNLPWGSQGIKVAHAWQFQDYRIIPDGAGGCVVAAAHQGQYYGYVGVSIQRLDGEGNILWSRWIPSPSQLREYSAGIHQLLLVADGQGGWILTYWTYWAGGSWVHRLDANGNELWPGGINIPGANVVGLRGLNGGAVIVYGGDPIPWWYLRNFYAQRLDENGNSMWVRRLDTAHGAGSLWDQTAVIEDYAGGTIIAWGIWSSIVAQRLDKDGNKLWSEPYMYVSTGLPGWRGRPRMTVDGEGGAVISWVDARIRWHDLYAQRVLADGRLGGGIEGFYIGAIQPNRGGDTGEVSVLMRGAGFMDGATVKLVGPGGEIEGKNTSLLDDSTGLATTFDLTGKARGLYDVVVTNPDGATATLPGAFTIEEGRAPEVWVDILGKGVIFKIIFISKLSNKIS